MTWICENEWRRGGCSGYQDRVTKAIGRSDTGKVSCFTVYLTFPYIYYLHPVRLMPILEGRGKGIVYCLIPTEWVHISVYLEEFWCQIFCIASPGSLRFISVSLLLVQETWSSQVHRKLHTWCHKILDQCHFYWWEGGMWCRKETWSGTEEAWILLLALLTPEGVTLGKAFCACASVSPPLWDLLALTS